MNQPATIDNKTLTLGSLKITYSMTPGEPADTRETEYSRGYPGSDPSLDILRVSRNDEDMGGFIDSLEMAPGVSIWAPLQEYIFNDIEDGGGT